MIYWLHRFQLLLPSVKHGATFGAKSIREWGVGGWPYRVASAARENKYTLDLESSLVGEMTRNSILSCTQTVTYLLFFFFSFFLSRTVYSFFIPAFRMCTRISGRYLGISRRDAEEIRARRDAGEGGRWYLAAKLNSDLLARDCLRLPKSCVSCACNNYFSADDVKIYGICCVAFVLLCNNFMRCILPFAVLMET